MAGPVWTGSLSRAAVPPLSSIFSTKSRVIIESKPTNKRLALFRQMTVPCPLVLSDIGINFVQYVVTRDGLALFPISG